MEAVHIMNFIDYQSEHSAAAVKDVQPIRAFIAFFNLAHKD